MFPLIGLIPASVVHRSDHWTDWAAEALGAAVRDANALAVALIELPVKGTVRSLTSSLQPACL